MRRGGRRGRDGFPYKNAGSTDLNTNRRSTALLLKNPLTKERHNNFHKSLCFGKQQQQLLLSLFVAAGANMGRTSALLLLLLLSAASLASLASAQTDQSYCKLDQEHTMCQHKVLKAPLFKQKKIPQTCQNIAWIGNRRPVRRPARLSRLQRAGEATDPRQAQRAEEQGGHGEGEEGSSR